MLLCHVNLAKWIFLVIFSRVATVREKQIFQDQGKVREFFKKSRKIFDIGKASEKSANSVFQFIANEFSAHYLNTCSGEKD